MLEFGLPVLFVLWIWWFSTGAILYVVGLPAKANRWILFGATLVALAAAAGLFATAGDTSTTGAYLAFTSALLVWGWHEVSFLTGTVTGPRKEPATPGVFGWRRFSQAAQTILYHEFAILLTAAVVVGLTWNGANQVGMWTFMVLWWMRLSAKLNLFFGVPNVPDDFLTSQLGFLKGYFRRRAMNPFFPLSVSVSTIVTVILIANAVSADATAFEAITSVFLATLLGLAVLEHWFLVLPVPVVEIWGWGMRSRKSEVPKSVGSLGREGGTGSQ